MMRPLDGIRLASAKLRAHRIRTTIITTIVALLFAGIIFVLAIFAGTTNSMEDFGREGLGSRYIVQATPILDRQGVYGSAIPDITDALNKETARLKAAKKTEAKRLGIEYDAASDQTLPMLETFDGKDKYTMPNFASSFVNQIMADYYNKTPHESYDNFSNVAKREGATSTYRSTASANTGFGTSQSSVTAIIDGKEQTTDSSKMNIGPPKGVEQITQGQWQYFDNELLKPFVFPGQSLAVGSDGSIPVIAPVNAAETFLKMKSLSSTASTDQELQHLITLRTNIAGKTAQLCYRNPASSELLHTATNQVQEFDRNKTKAGYVPPSLQYNVPSDACGAVTIKKDTRSADDKKRDENQLSFKTQFEGYEAPAQGIITVRFVGLVPDLNYAPSFSVKDMLKGMLQSGLGNGWFSPVSSVKPDSVAAKVSTPYDTAPLFSKVYYAEFSDYQSAKDFTKKTSCDIQLGMEDMMNYRPNQPDPRVAKCYTAGKYFDIMPFGNNASAIADLKQTIWKVMRYVAPVVLSIAALVLMGIVGKIIADSRRETAVFRALGATRSSIAQIYVTYSLFIALFIIVLSGLIGSIAAFVLSRQYSPQISPAAVLAYNSADAHKQFVLFGVDPLYFAVVFGLIVLATLLSTVIPLLTNIRRNPISDMRDE